MKTFYSFTILFCFITSNLFAQIIDVATGILDPSRLALSGTDLFVTNGSGGQIYKIDLTQPFPVTPSLYLDGQSGTGSMLINGNDLYFCNYGGDKISKIDITDANPTPVDVIVGPNGPNALVLNGNDLYYVESVPGNVMKIDITDANPTPIEVVGGLDFPIGLALNGNDLYISVNSSSKIVKVDITQTLPATPVDVVTGLSSPNTLVLDGNDLYVSQFNGSEISKIDITDPTPSATPFLTGLSEPNGFVKDGNDFYLNQKGANKISKYTLVSLAAQSSICDSGDGVVLTGLGGGLPEGGVYSGTGVTDDGNGMTYSFDPSVAGVGTHTITYTDMITTATADVLVFNAPTVSINLPDTIFVMNGMPPAGVVGGGMPEGGVYTDAYNEITDDGNGTTFSFNATLAVGELNSIIYTFTDVNGCVNSASNTIFVAEAPVGLNDLEKVNLAVFPNPTNGVINFEGATIERIEVIDLHGKILRIEDTPMTTLDISALPSGIYFLKVNVEDQVLTKRILKE
ncbi:MAG: T9SS type A sorting domain-containing protein [Saprospiraceae bacterium]